MTSLACPELTRSSAAQRAPRLVTWLLFLGVALAGTAAAKDLPEQAREWKNRLTGQIMPYWNDTALDWRNGGYVLADDAAKKAPPAAEKQIVSQSRMVWTFSLVHRKHLVGDGRRDYLKAAENGYRFLISHFLDEQNGGYFWKTDLAGKPVHDCKFLYGQSFVVYALVEYYRASGDRQALQHALNLYQVVQAKLHDTKNGGWVEHATRDWQPLASGDARNEVEVVGFKSANSHLHWMEALAELYDVTKAKDVRNSLREALRINSTYFYPMEPGKSTFHRHPDWRRVTDPKSAGLSYGHNVEFAWLMIRAEEALGQPPSWQHFDAVMDHALKYGYDHARGGLYNRGFGDAPATDTDKVWWVQAEMLAALTDGYSHSKKPAYADAIQSLLQFVSTYQACPEDQIWLDTVTAEGKPKSTGKAHAWKANYHDGRAIVKFIEAFAR